MQSSATVCRWLILFAAGCARSHGADGSTDAGPGGEGEGEGGEGEGEGEGEAADAGPSSCTWTDDRVAWVGSGGQSAVAIGPLGYAQVLFCAGPDAEGDGAPGFRYGSNYEGDWSTRDWVPADGCEGPALVLLGDGSFVASFAGLLGDWAVVEGGGGDQPPPSPEPGVERAEWAWGYSLPWGNEGLRARGATGRAVYFQEPYLAATAYHHPSGELRVVYTEAGLQSPVETVDTGCPATSEVSVAFDAGGELHAAWVSCGELRYARREDGAWPVAVVAEPESANVGDAALAIGPEPSVEIAYRRGGDVGVATRSAGGDWALEDVEVGHDATGVSFCIAPDGTRHMAWADDARGLRHAWRRPEGWDVESTGAPVAPADAAIAAGPSGALAISYRDGTELHVLYRPCAPE